MFFKKAVGSIEKKAKMVTCAVLAVCILAATFVSLPFATSADPSPANSVETENAIFIGSTSRSIACAFIPLNIAPTSKSYYKLSFKCKWLKDGGSSYQAGKPSVGIIGQNSSQKAGTCPSWAGSDYNNNTNAAFSDGVYSMVFSLDGGSWNKTGDKYGRGSRACYITIGNGAYRNFSNNASSVSFKNFGCSFIFSDVKLYTCNSDGSNVGTTNLMPTWSEDAINFDGAYALISDGGTGSDYSDSPAGALADKWHIMNMPEYVKEITVPSDYNTSANYNSNNFTKTEETDYTREYYTNTAYSDLKFNMLPDSNDKAFEIIPDDINKKMIIIDANHEGEEDARTTEPQPTKNKPANIFIPLSLGQYCANACGGVPETNFLVKVSFNARRLEGNGYPVIGRITARDTDHSQALGKMAKNLNLSGYYTAGNHETYNGGEYSYDESTGAFVGWLRMKGGDATYRSVYGTSEILTIGNSEHVWTEGKFDTTEFNTSFAISNIKIDLYSCTGSYTVGSLVYEDIAPALYADTVDDTSNWAYQCGSGKTYSAHAHDVARAKANYWQVDGCTGMVHAEDLTECIKNNHVLNHISATSDVCEHYNCLACDKNYADSFGKTELTDVTAKKQMITIGATSEPAAAFLPIRLAGFTGVKYFRFTCQVQTSGEGVPTLSTFYPVRDGSLGTGINPVDNDKDMTIIEQSYDKEEGVITGLLRAWIAGNYNKSDRYPYIYYSPVTSANVALVVGNGKFESKNGNTNTPTEGFNYNYSSKDSEFAFINPELYALSGDTIDSSIQGANLIPDITTKTVDLNDNYQIIGNRVYSTDSPMSAPLNTWGKVGTGRDSITVSDLDSSYFPDPADYDHVWTKHDPVAPTIDDEGTTEYYTCDCPYHAGKYYADEGITRLTKNDITIPAIGHKQAVLFNKNSEVSNIFIPLNFTKTGDKEYNLTSGENAYFKLTFKLRNYGEGMPIVSKVNFYPSSTNVINTSTTIKYATKSSKDHVYNNGAGSGASNPNSGIFYASYDPETFTYTTIIRTYIRWDYAGSPTGCHTAILIGNAEHNAANIDERNYDAEFLFADPQLYAYNTSTKETFGENLITDITTTTASISDGTYSGGIYRHLSDPYTAADNIMSAPANKWSIDNDASNIEFYDYDASFFAENDDVWVYNEAKKPNNTQNGNNPYYSCDCEKHSGKYYANRGLKELKEEDVIIPSWGKSQMLHFNKNSSVSNLFIPLNFTKTGDKEYDFENGETAYFKLTFKLKDLNDNKPVISVVVYDPWATKVRVSGSNVEYASRTQRDNVYNNGVGNGSTNTDPDNLYVSYDESTCTYTAIVKTYLRWDYAGSPTGCHTAILIGNAEHNGNSIYEYNYSAEYLIAKPELYAYDTATKTTFGENLITDIAENTVKTKDGKYNGNIYKYRKDPDTDNNNIMMAPANTWSVDNTADNMEFLEYDESYFAPSSDNWVYHEAKKATSDKDGNKVYYSCDCDTHKGKYYSNKGFTELDKNDVIIPAWGESKMIRFKANSKLSNIFIPLDFRSSGDTVNDVYYNNRDAKYYFKLSFKVKNFGDGMPIVSKLRYDPYAGTNTASYSEQAHVYNNGAGNGETRGDENFYAVYDEETCVYSVILRTTIDDLYSSSATGCHTAILIGNAEHHGNVTGETNYNADFAISQPTLYAYNIDTKETFGENLITDITDNTFIGDKYKHTKNPYTGSDNVMAASANQWHIDGDDSTIELMNIPDKYFVPQYSLVASGGTGSFTTPASLAPDTTYKLTYKSKFNTSALAIPYVEFTTYSGIKKVNASVCRRNSDGIYNTSYTFRTPSDLIPGTNARLGVELTSSEISGSFTDFRLYECGSDGNATGNNLLDDAVIYQDTPFLDYSSAAKPGNWYKQGTATFLNELVPARNYEIRTPHMFVFRGGISNGVMTQKLTAKAGSTYRVTYQIKYAGTGLNGEKPGTVFSYINTAGETVQIPYTESYNASNYLMTCEFTVPANIKDAENNFIFSFNFADALLSGYATNFAMYEISGISAIGGNIIKNGNFATGTDDGWGLSGAAIRQYVEIPANFFSISPSHNKHALQYRDTSDFELLQQMLQVKPSTRYELQYTSLVTGYVDGEPYGVVYQKLNEYVCYNKINGADCKWTYVEYKDGAKKWSELNDENFHCEKCGATKSSFRKESSWNYMSDDEKNANLEDSIIKTTKVTVNEAALGSYYDSSDIKNRAIRITKTFITSDFLNPDSSNNLSVRFYFMSNSSGYIGDYTLYELDENGNRIGYNILLDPDFSCGFQQFSDSTPWNYSNKGNVRNIELENGFFENYTMPTTMIKSDGKTADETYGNQLFVEPDSTYYFSGYMVKSNFSGFTPQILYRSISAGGKYVAIPFELYFDATRYYFETQGGFKIPDDALLNESGMADIIVRMSNGDHGKGYLAGLSLTKDDGSHNYFSDANAAVDKFVKLAYDPEVFVPFEGDEGFEDGDWSGEAYTVTTGAVEGFIFDEDGYAISGVTMKLMPGNLTSVTDDSGAFKFDKLNPGVYKLYLVEENGNEIFCYEINVEAGILTTLSDITYIPYSEDGEGSVIIDTDAIKTSKYGAIKGYVYDSTGKLLEGIDIYCNSKSHHAKTNSKGIFEFEQVPPGTYKICTILDDGTVHVFKTVKVEAGKGIVVKVMMPDNSGFPVWAIVLISVGGALVLAGGVLLTIFLIKRKKAANSVKTAAPAAEPEEISE